MRQAFDRLRLTDSALPFVLLLAVGLAYGLLIPALGFFWDDWPVIYIGRLEGVGAYWDFYQYDRPFSAWTYVLLYPILGARPLAWQILTLLFRWLTSVFLWSSLRLVWPAKPGQIFWVALLFAVCPVFTFQPVAVAYVQHWICFLLYFASILLMLKAQQPSQCRHVFTLGAVGLALVQWFTMEYFVGLEFLRPVLLWLYYRENHAGASLSKPLKQVAASAWIYGLTLVVYVIWRFFFLHLAEADPNQPVWLGQLFETPLPALLGLAQRILQDLVYLLAYWTTVVKPDTLDLLRPFSLAVLVSSILGAALVGIVAGRYEPGVKESSETAWYRQALLVGLLAVVFGTLPVWLIDRQISTGALGNRFSLAAMFGLCLTIVGILDWLAARDKVKLTVVCILVGMAVHANLFTAKTFQTAWEKQRTFYWQLFWRAPYVQPDTAFIADGEIFPFVGLYSTSMGISLLYPPVSQPGKVPYWFFSYWEGIATRQAEVLQGVALEDRLRNYSFLGDSQDSIVLFFSPEEGRCLQLVSPRNGDDRGIPEVVLGLANLSDLGRIRPESVGGWSPPQVIFGPEPDHTWCYYFEKAQLAYQYEDWEGVIRWMGMAKEQGYSPVAHQELIPLLDAYLRSGDLDSAVAFSLQIKKLTDKLDDQVCNAWLYTDAGESNPRFEPAFDQVREKIVCFD